MRPKRTVEESLDVMAEAMLTLSGRVSELQQQMAYVQQEKLDSPWAQVEALTQGGRNCNLSGAQPRVPPTLSATEAIPTTIDALRSDPVMMWRAADRQVKMQHSLHDLPGNNRVINLVVIGLVVPTTS